MSRNELNYGIEINGFTTDFDFYNSLNRRISQKENTSASDPQIINRFCEATYLSIILSFAQTHADTLSPSVTLSGSLFPATSL